jgi:arylsulfatase A-like enzyme
MAPKSRTRMLLLLSVLLWALVLHDLYWFRWSILGFPISPGFLSTRLGEHRLPLVAIMAVVVTAGVFIGFKARRRAFLESTFLPLLIGSLAILVAALLLVSYPHGVPPLEWSAFAAIALTASIIILTVVSRRSHIAIGHAVLGMLLGLALISIGLKSGRGGRANELEQFIERTIDDINARSTSWAGIESSRIIDMARESAPAGNLVRFENLLGELKIVKAPHPDEDRGILYEIPRDGRLIPISDSGAPSSRTSDQGITIDRYPGNLPLRNDEPLGIRPKGIGSILLRMKCSSGRSFKVRASENESLRAEDEVEIPLVPGEEFQTYELAKSLLERFPSEKLNFISVTPSDREARVEISFLRILSPAGALCRDAPLEVGYHDKNGETRKVIYARTPCELVFPMDVPDNDATLYFGLDAADPSVGVEFSLEVKSDRAVTPIFSAELEENAHWTDHSVSLEPWSGRSVEMTLRTHSSAPNIVIWSNPVVAGVKEPVPNIVIYLIDCLRADHLGAYGYDRPTSPVFDRLALRGTLFENAYSNGCTTKRSIPSLFTSNPISATGVWGTFDVLSEGFPTLAEVLRARGYTTASFTMNTNAGESSGCEQGFSQLFYQKSLLPKEREWGPPGTNSDAEILIGDRLQEWIDRNKSRNFFLYVHTMDAHTPYNPPYPYSRFPNMAKADTLSRDGGAVDGAGDRPGYGIDLESLYDGEIAYGDFHLGRFVEMLERAGVLDHTLLIITADHGEYFGEHGMWGHNPPPFRQGTHIPMLIVGPNGTFPTTRVSQNVQILDIMPTVLNVVGLSDNQRILQGRDLLPLARGETDGQFEGRPVFVESLRPGETSFYYKRFHFLPEKNLIFDLLRDPEEQEYLNEFLVEFGLKSKARDLSKAYKKCYEALQRNVIATKRGAADLDPETLKQLRALGYID